MLHTTVSEAQLTILELEPDSTAGLNVVDVFPTSPYHVAHHLLLDLNLYQ